MTQSDLGVQFVLQCAAIQCCADATHRTAEALDRVHLEELAHSLCECGAPVNTKQLEQLRE